MRGLTFPTLFVIAHLFVFVTLPWMTSGALRGASSVVETPTLSSKTFGRQNPEKRIPGQHPPKQASSFDFLRVLAEAELGGENITEYEFIDEDLQNATEFLSSQEALWNETSDEEWQEDALSDWNASITAETTPVPSYSGENIFQHIASDNSISWETGSLLEAAQSSADFSFLDFDDPASFAAQFAEVLMEGGNITLDEARLIQFVIAHTHSEVFETLTLDEEMVLLQNPLDIVRRMMESTGQDARFVSDEAILAVWEPNGVFVESGRRLPCNDDGGDSILCEFLTEEQCQLLQEATECIDAIQEIIVASVDVFLCFLGLRSIGKPVGRAMAQRLSRTKELQDAFGGFVIELVKETQEFAADSLFDLAFTIWKCGIQEIGTGAFLEDIISNLNWWDVLWASIILLLEITAILLSGGASLFLKIAIKAVTLVQFGFAVDGVISSCATGNENSASAVFDESASGSILLQLEGTPAAIDDACTTALAASLVSVYNDLSCTQSSCKQIDSASINLAIDSIGASAFAQQLPFTWLVDTDSSCITAECETDSLLFSTREGKSKALFMQFLQAEIAGGPCSEPINSISNAVDLVQKDCTISAGQFVANPITFAIRTKGDNIVPSEDELEFIQELFVKVYNEVNVLGLGSCDPNQNVLLGADGLLPFERSRKLKKASKKKRASGTQEATSKLSKREKKSKSSSSKKSAKSSKKSSKSCKASTSSKKKGSKKSGKGCDGDELVSTAPELCVDPSDTNVPGVQNFGTCFSVDCSGDGCADSQEIFALSDDFLEADSRKRRLQAASCFCPSFEAGALPQAPTAEEIQLAFEDTITKFYDSFSTVECVAPLLPFRTETILEFTRSNSSIPVAEREVDAFVTLFESESTRIQELEACDPFNRRDISLSFQEILSSATAPTNCENEQVDCVVMETTGKCSGCRSYSANFLGSARRSLAESVGASLGFKRRSLTQASQSISCLCNSGANETLTSELFFDKSRESFCDLIDTLDTIASVDVSGEYSYNEASCESTTG